MSKEETFFYQGEPLHRLTLESGVVIALREPDPPVMFLAGISFFGFTDATEPKAEGPDFGNIPEGEGEVARKLREAKLELMAHAAGKDTQIDPAKKAEHIRKVTADMMRLVVWICAGYFTPDGEFLPGGFCFEKLPGRVPVRNLTDNDLVAIWNWTLGFGRKEAEGREHMIATLRDFLAIAKRAALGLPRRPIRDVRRELDGHFHTVYAA